MMTTKNKNKYFSYLQKQFSKFAVVLVVASMLFGTLCINQTSAYFTSSATVSGNTFTAGTLDISTVSDLGPVSLSVAKNYNIINQGSLPFKYRMTALISGGSDTTFCGQLNIAVSKDTGTLYTGGLSGLSFIKLLNNGTQDDLTFTITDSGTNPAGKVCSFNFVLKAWQTELDYGQGFTDTTSTKAVVYSANTDIPLVSSGVVLNEFLPNPNGTEYEFNFGEDADAKPQGEWIELYNNSSTAVILTGWFLKDNEGDKIDIEGCRTNTGGVTIEANGFLVVYRKGDDTCNSHGFDLENSGGSITLWNNNTIADTTTYSGGVYCDMKPTPGDDNETNPSGPCTSVPPNKSYARIPDGVGAWVDPIPTPGISNELAEEIIPEVDTTTDNTGTTDTAITESEPATAEEKAAEDLATQKSAEEKARLEAEAKAATEKAQAEADAKLAAEKIQAEIDEKAAADLAAAEKTQAELDAKVAAEKAQTQAEAEKKATAETSTVDTPAVGTSASE